MRYFFKSFKFQSALLVLATAVIYGLCINNLNLWSDEIYSVLMAKDSLPQMWDLLTTEDSKPPLYYLYLKGVLALFAQNYEIWAAHFGSFLLLLAAEIFSLTALRRDYGNSMALLMVMVLALMPCSLWLAFEVRTYMLSALLLFMALVYGLRILEKPANADFVKFGATSVAALYSHYYCAIALMFLYLFILFFLIKDKTFNVNGKKFVVTAMIVTVLFAPWLVVPFSSAGEISQDWYVDEAFLKFSPLFFINPFDPEIFQSIFYMATNFITVSFSFIVFSGIFVLAEANHKNKRLYWFSFGIFIASYLLLIGLSIAFRPMVTARYLKIFSLLWYLSGAVVLSQFLKLAKAFGCLAVLLFGFSYADIRAIAFDRSYTDAVHDIQSFIPKENKLLALDNANLFCEYYLPEHTCLSIVGKKGEILRKPSIMKNIKLYSEEPNDTTFVLSIYTETTDVSDCMRYQSIYRRGQTLKLCKYPKFIVEKLLNDSLNLRLKNYLKH